MKNECYIKIVIDYKRITVTAVYAKENQTVEIEDRIYDFLDCICKFIGIYGNFS